MECRICALPSTVPSAKIDESNLCFYCRQVGRKKDLGRLQEDYKSRFEKLIVEYKDSENERNYDAGIAYSGGKDSSFTLDLFKSYYKLRVLALTFDNGFISPYAWDNIQRIIETLGVDHIVFKPNLDLIKKIFKFSTENDFHPPKALERASSICNSCMGLVRFMTLRYAIDRRIPFIVFGWSPGQAPTQSAIFKNYPSMIRKFQNLLLKPFEQAAGPDVKAYFLEDRLLDQDISPYSINPLVFLPYDEEVIYSRISELGWQPPKDTDPCSTNCLLNSFAVQDHLKRHGYHPYAMEMAWLVRLGVITREEAVNRLSEKPDERIIDAVQESLGFENESASYDLHVRIPK